LNKTAAQPIRLRKTIVTQRGGSETLAIMPPPEVYDEEHRYWPWGRLICWAASWVEKNAPRDSAVYDYMCGTGHLLALIRQARADLRVSGCDINASFVDYAMRKYDAISIECADARSFHLSDPPGILLCTAGLHHLTHSEQEAFLDKTVSECDQKTLVLIGEEVVEEYCDEQTRRLAALRLGHSLIEYGIKSDWPSAQIEAAVDVLKNDVLLRGEYKRSVKELECLLQQRFVIVEARWIWRASGGGGDIVFICRRR
jgi:SAM-dependent methyltransferase